MIPEFSAYTGEYLDKDFTVHTKVFGNNLFWDGQTLKKGPNKPITLVDRLISDQYTTPESLFDKDSPTGYYTYNQELGKVVTHRDYSAPGFLSLIPSSFKFTAEMEKSIRMNHVNTILKSVGFDVNYKKIINSILFKINDKPKFKVIIRRTGDHRIPSHLIKMIGYLFFNEAIPVVNVYTDNKESIVSVANQIFLSKVSKDIIFDNKMVFNPYMSVKDISTKCGIIGNSAVRDVILENNHMYYIYTSMIIMLINNKCDKHITDAGILQNLDYYRQVIGSEPKVLSFKEFDQCRKSVQI